MKKYTYFLVAGLIFLVLGLFGNAYAQSGHGHGHSGQDSNKTQDLKSFGPDNVVASVVHCSGTYSVSTASGATYTFKEFDLRLKIDTGDSGPVAGKPVLIPVGMGGDRSAVVFSSVSELKSVLRAECKK